MNNAEILVIDDEEQMRRLLEITLQSNGLHCKRSKHGKRWINSSS